MLCLDSWVCSPEISKHYKRFQESRVTTARVQYIKETEALALDNIKRTQEKQRNANSRASTKRKAMDMPQVGSLVLITAQNVDKNARGGLQRLWENNVYKCAGYNTTMSQLLVQEGGGEQCYENITNCKAYSVGDHGGDET